MEPVGTELGINPSIVAKCPKRATVENLKAGLKKARSIVLSEAEKAMIVAFRVHTLLVLNNW